jgi:hypothetical protein
MAESYRTRLLEVSLTAIKPDQWEWQVFENDTPIMMSYRARPQDTARHASNGGERNGSAVVARGISGANIKVKASLTFPQWLQLISATPSSVEAD